MKKGLTEIVFILDRSGSMSGLESDTIGGFNSLINKQKKEPGEALISTVLFDDAVEILHDRVNLIDVMPMTDKEYFVRGCTALLDAVGSTINHIGRIHAEMKEGERPENVLIIITTDGMENSSREYSYSKVKNLIDFKKEEGWEFLFLGANIDAAEVAGRFGISPEFAADYYCDSQGTAVNFDALNDAVYSLRCCSKQLSEDWKAKIDEDYNNRKY